MHSFTKMHLKISSVKWWPFCTGGWIIRLNSGLYCKLMVAVISVVCFGCHVWCDCGGHKNSNWIFDERVSHRVAIEWTPGIEFSVGEGLHVAINRVLDSHGDENKCIQILGESKSNASAFKFCITVGQTVNCPIEPMGTTHMAPHE